MSFFYCLSATEIRHSYPCRFLFIDAETVVRSYGKILVHVFLGARCAKTRRAVIGKKYPPPGKKWGRTIKMLAFIYSGRRPFAFDYSTVTSRNPLQLLEHPRFLGGADERPPCCYGLMLMGSDINAEDYKLHYNKQ